MGSKVKKKKKSEASVMHFKYYGYADSNDGGYHIVKISGRKFFKYLILSV
jgi:hypothetical protein